MSWIKLAASLFLYLGHFDNSSSLTSFQWRPLPLPPPGFPLRSARFELQEMQHPKLPRTFALSKEQMTKLQTNIQRLREKNDSSIISKVNLITLEQYMNLAQKNFSLPFRVPSFLHPSYYTETLFKAPYFLPYSPLFSSMVNPNWSLFGGGKIEDIPVNTESSPINPTGTSSSNFIQDPLKKKPQNPPKVQIPSQIASISQSIANSPKEEEKEKPEKVKVDEIIVPSTYPPMTLPYNEEKKSEPTPAQMKGDENIKLLDFLMPTLANVQNSKQEAPVSEEEVKVEVTIPEKSIPEASTTPPDPKPQVQPLEKEVTQAPIPEIKKDEIIQPIVPITPKNEPKKEEEDMMAGAGLIDPGFAHPLIQGILGTGSPITTLLHNSSQQATKAPNNKTAEVMAVEEGKEKPQDVHDKNSSAVVNPIPESSTAKIISPKEEELKLNQSVKIKQYVEKPVDPKALCSSYSDEPDLNCNRVCTEKGYEVGNCKEDGGSCICQSKGRNDIGLRLHYYTEPFNSELPEDFYPFYGRCDTCGCHQKCKQRGWLLGLCDNSCYCGSPWIASSDEMDEFEF